MDKQIFIFIAPPGAGKSTQGELLANENDFYHFELSKLLHDFLEHADPNDPMTQKIKEINKTGLLWPSDIVLDIVLKKIHELADQGKPIIFNGPFRKLDEAQVELPVVEELYGKKNIKVLYLDIDEAESIKRNQDRRICQLNRHPIPNFPEFADIATCPQDGSPLIKREEDSDPTALKTRYQVYIQETAPVLDYFRQQGIDVDTINGAQPIHQVHEDIIKHIRHDQH